MSIFLMVLTCLNIILVLVLAFSVFLRVKEKKEDQRITKGLQLLQHKISILQDLSDKTDEQVQRLVFMLDSKSNELRRLTLEATQVALNAQITLQNTSKEMPAVFNTHTSFSAPTDELSQFVQALSQQNDKAKPSSTNSAPNTRTKSPENTVVTSDLNSTSAMPQDFMDTAQGSTEVIAPSPQTTKSTATPAARPVKLFQFKKI